MSGSDLYRWEVEFGRLAVLAVALRDKYDANDRGSGCHIEQQRLLREGYRQDWR